jgi:hypothetical protein
MGIKLYVEVMDHAPLTLTHREHKALLIFAEDANEKTRLLWHSPEDALMLRRLRLSRSQMYVVVGVLVEKGCLEQITKGGGGHDAKYRIRSLVPELCPENRDAEPGELRPGNRDTGAGELRPGIQDAGPESAGPSASRKPGPSVSRKSESCVPVSGTHPPTPLSTPVTDPPSPADEEGTSAAPLPSPNPGDDNGPEHSGPDDQHSPAMDPLQALAEVGSAGAGARPRQPMGRHAKPSEATDG